MEAPRGPQVDVIYPGPDALNEQQPYVCESKRNRSKGWACFAVSFSAIVGFELPLSAVGQ
jgi:hypothetical protein